MQWHRFVLIVPCQRAGSRDVYETSTRDEGYETSTREVGTRRGIGDVDRRRGVIVRQTRDLNREMNELEGGGGD